MKSLRKAQFRHAPSVIRRFELSGLNSGVPTPLAPGGAASQSNQLPPVAGLNSGVPTPVAGFSLVEVVIAIGIAAFCLVTMLGLIPSGMKAVNATTEQTAATAIISEVMTDLRDTPLGSNTSPILAIQLPPNVTTNDSIDGTGTNTTNFYVSESCTLYPTNTSLDARYGVTLSLSNSSVFITTARVQVWWPSVAAPSNAVGSVEAISAIMRQ